MSFITCDLETYFDKEYSLSRMSTEAYINDPRFQIIGVGVKIDDGPSQWYSGPEPQVFLRQYDCDNSAWLFHNAYFDAAILFWKFGIRPAMIYDTMCMCKISDGVLEPASLKAMSERHGTGVKGNDLMASIGKRLEDFTPEGLKAFGMYCRNDVDITYKLFNKLSVGFPEIEFKLIDLTVRMFTQPTLEIDSRILEAKLQYIRNTKSALLNGLMGKLDCDDEEAVRKKLASNKQFAELLLELGMNVPMKISAKTGKPAYALAKNDMGFMQLQDHPDPFIQQLCSVRLGVKSTMEETRIVKFIDTAERNHNKLPVPLKYCAAHTMRWGGMDDINLQNLPSRDKDKRTLKNSIRAPAGHVIVHGDSSQIEARKLAWWAGQDDVVALFRTGQDVYCHDATAVYGSTVTKANEQERFVGKTMRLGLGYGTGAEKLKNMLATSQKSIVLEMGTCYELVRRWRDANPSIVHLWADADKALKDVMSWPDGKRWYWLGKHDVVLVTPLGFKLPNNTWMRYKNLHVEDGVVYHDSRYGQTKIWGGTVVENITQALARITIGEQMVKLSEKYRPVLTVHDSIAIVSHESEQREAVEFMTACMNEAPPWATDLPIACEIKVGETYGDC